MAAVHDLSDDGSGPSGRTTVFVAISGVAIQICDILRKPAYEKVMLVEVEVYSSLLRLQGRVILELKGVGYTSSGLFVLMMRLAWFPINSERIPDEERKIARTALGIFTDLAILAKICVPRTSLYNTTATDPK